MDRGRRSADDGWGDNQYSMQVIEHALEIFTTRYGSVAKILNKTTHGGV